MRRFSLWMAVTSIVLLAGCAGEEGPMSGKDKINEDDEALLTEVQDIQAQSLEGLDHSIGIKLSEKAEKMSELIRNGGCKPEYNTPLFLFDRNWVGKASVTGLSPCPVDAKRTWSYDRPSENFVFSDTFTNRSDEYKKLDRIIAKALFGNLDVTRDSDGSIRISGHITLELEISDLGKIAADVQTTQTYQGNTGSGALKLTMIVADKEKYIGEVTWDKNFFAKYRLNGHDSDRKTFDKFFSQLHVNEMIDWSQDLRNP